jgi:hypothetical protein
MWGTIKSAVGAIAGAIRIGEWFTKKKDRVDAEEAGAAKQRAADANETTSAVADGAKADAAMRRPGSKRRNRVRRQFSRDGEGR